MTNEHEFSPEHDNIDQFKDEYDADKAAKDAAEAARLEAEYAAKRQAEREAYEQAQKERDAKLAEERKQRIVRDNAYLANIAGAVRSPLIIAGSDREVVHDTENGKLSIAGIDMSSKIHIERDRKLLNPGVASWRRRYEDKGTFSIKIGNNYRRGDCQKYPQRKNGDHDYARIAADLLQRVNNVITSNKRADVRKNNSKLALELADKLGLRRFTSPLSLEGSDQADKPITVTLRVDRIMTLTQVEDMVRALKEIGIDPAKAHWE